MSECFENSVFFTLLVSDFVSDLIHTDTGPQLLMLFLHFWLFCCIYWYLVLVSDIISPSLTTSVRINEWLWKLLTFSHGITIVVLIVSSEKKDFKSNSTPHHYVKEFQRLVSNCLSVLSLRHPSLVRFWCLSPKRQRTMLRMTFRFWQHNWNQPHSQF